MEYWYDYGNKNLTLRFLPQHFWKFHWGTNGAKKSNPKDTCYDLNIHFFGVFFSYTNFNYQK
jgi:hypothetical protein